jgi:hypothetical protein
MAEKIVAIVGTCRKGKIIDTAVSEILGGAREHGAETVGARVIQSLHFDCLAETPESPRSDKARHRARQAGARLATS